MKHFLFFLFLLGHSFVFCQKEIPIMAFHGVQTNNVEDFKKFREAGFSISLKAFQSTADAIDNMNAASKAGVKVFVYTDSLMLNPEIIVPKIKDNLGLYGYYVADEPSVKDFDKVGWRTYNIRKTDNNLHPVYINLFPNYAGANQLGVVGYSDYLELFMKKVNVDFISFDNYPVKGNTLDKNWYDNLEQIRKLSNKYQKPFWAYANATIFQEYAQPTKAGIRIQQYSNLLYGAKGLQYFTYWTLEKSYREKNNYRYSIVDENGNKTPTYTIIENFNKQVQKLAWIFMDSHVTQVYHVGKTLPIGVVKMARLPENFVKLDTNGKEALISAMENEKQKFILILNKDLNNTLKLSYQVQSNVKSVNSSTGSLEAIKTKNTITLLPGDLYIFTYNQ